MAIAYVLVVYFYKLLYQCKHIFFNLMQHIHGDWRGLFTSYIH